MSRVSMLLSYRSIRLGTDDPGEHPPRTRALTRKQSSLLEPTKGVEAMQTVTSTLASFGVAALIALVPVPLRAEEDGPTPERVTFMSADGRTVLVGYLYR